MKNHITFLCTLLCVLLIGTAGVAQELEYVDGTTLTQVNKVHPTARPYSRLEVSKYPDLSKTVRRYYSHSTGVALVFRNCHEIGGILNVFRRIRSENLGRP